MSFDIDRNNREIEDIKSTPILGLQPVAAIESSKYGIQGVSAFIDKDGQVYSLRYIGGDIAFDKTGGTVTVYRIPAVSFGVQQMVSADPNNLGWLNKFINAMAKITEELAKVIVVDEVIPSSWYDPQNNLTAQNLGDYSDLLTRVAVKNRFELQKLFDKELWSTIIKDLFEGFPKQAIGNDEGTRMERFFIASFAANKNGLPITIPGEINTADHGIIYFKPPTNSLTHITRVSTNVSIWVATTKILGFSTKLAMPIYDWILANWGVSTKAFENYLSIIASEGFSPCGLRFLGANPAHSRTLNLIKTFVRSMALCKMFEYVSQQIKDTDYKFETTYNVFYPGLPDAQFEQLINSLYNKFTNQQLKAVRGSLGPKGTIKIFPMDCKKGSGYRISENRLREAVHESKEYTGQPCVYFNEIRFQDVYDVNGNYLTPGEAEGYSTRGLTIADRDDLKWVDLMNLQNVETEQAIAYNRINGDVHVMNMESVGYYSIVYPNNLNTRPPVTTAMKLEERHWPLIYSEVIPRQPPIYLQSKSEMMITNQASFLGPKHYLSGLNASNVVTDNTNLHPFINRLDLAIAAKWNSKEEIK